MDLSKFHICGIYGAVLCAIGVELGHETEWRHGNGITILGALSIALAVILAFIKEVNK